MLLFFSLLATQDDIIVLCAFVVSVCPSLTSSQLIWKTIVQRERYTREIHLVVCLSGFFRTAVDVLIGCNPVETLCA